MPAANSSTMGSPQKARAGREEPTDAPSATVASRAPVTSRTARPRGSATAAAKSA